MKDIKIIISSLLIFISFFLGYIMSEKKQEKNNSINKYNYVNIEILKTKMKISKNENTKITINGNIIENEIYNLK